MNISDLFIDDNTSIHSDVAKTEINSLYPDYKCILPNYDFTYDNDSYETKDTCIPFKEDSLYCPEETKDLISDTVKIKDVFAGKYSIILKSMYFLKYRTQYFNDLTGYYYLSQPYWYRCLVKLPLMKKNTKLNIEIFSFSCHKIIQKLNIDNIETKDEESIVVDGYIIYSFCIQFLVNSHKSKSIYFLQLSNSETNDIYTRSSLFGIISRKVNDDKSKQLKNIKQQCYTNNKHIEFY